MSLNSEQFLTKEIPWPHSNPDNYKVDELFEEPIYDPSVHLDLQLPEYIVNLKFDVVYLKDFNLEDENDARRLEKFLSVGVAFTSPFKVLSEEGLRVLRGIIHHHMEHSPQLSKHTDRQAWCMRGLGYVSRYVRDLNRCEVVSKKMGVFAGKPLNAHAMPLNYSHVNIGIAGTGKKVDQWHLDSVGFVVVIIISEPKGIVGGELQVLKRDRSENNHSSLLDILNSQTNSYTPKDILTANYDSAGNGIFMQGSHIYHQVTPVLQSTVGPRISLVNSFMTANVFDEDWTKFSTFRDGDPQHITYLEYARLVSWRANGMLEHVIKGIEFDAIEGKPVNKEKAIDVMDRAIRELSAGYKLLRGETDDLIGYHDSNEKTIKGYCVNKR